MKRNLAFIMIWAVAALALTYADIYIKQKVHTDSYYYGGITTPAQDEYTETWIGSSQMASITPGQIRIVDLGLNRAIILKPTDRTYVEIPLPLDFFKLVPDPVIPYLRGSQETGTVKPTGKTKKIDRWQCQQYEINSYILIRGNREYDKDTLLWVSTDVPFDLDKYHRMKTDLQQLENFSQVFHGELNKIRGYPILSESFLYIKGTQVRSVTSVIEMVDKIPPPGIYSIPDGYTVKEKLSF